MVCPRPRATRPRAWSRGSRSFGFLKFGQGALQAVNDERQLSLQDRLTSMLPVRPALDRGKLRGRSRIRRAGPRPRRAPYARLRRGCHSMNSPRWTSIRERDCRSPKSPHTAPWIESSIAARIALRCRATRKRPVVLFGSFSVGEAGRTGVNAPRLRYSTRVNPLESIQRTMACRRS